MSSDDSCSNSSPNYNKKQSSLIKPSSSSPVPGNAGNNKNSTGAEVDTTAASSASIRRRIKRKRKNCRSQFRHEAMEIIKLGSNVSSSLCKSKEPYVSKIAAAEKKSQESVIQLSHNNNNNNNNNVHTKNNNNNSAHVDSNHPPPQPGFNPRIDPPPAVYINASSSNTTTSSSTYIHSRPQTYPPANPNLNNNNYPQYQMFGGHVLPQMVPERRISRDGVIMSPPQNHHQSVIQGPAPQQQEHPRNDPRLYSMQQDIKLVRPSVVDMSKKRVPNPNEKLRLEKKMLEANDKLLHRLNEKAVVHSNEKVNLSDMVSRIKKVVHLNETLLHLNKKMHSNEMIETPTNQKAQRVPNENTRDERSRPPNEKMVYINERTDPKTSHPSDERLLHPNERLLYPNDRVARHPNERMPHPGERKLYLNEKPQSSSGRVVFHSNGERPPDMPHLNKISYAHRPFQNQRPLPPNKRPRLDETAFQKALDAVSQINLIRREQLLGKTTYDPAEAAAAIDLTLPHASYHLKKCSERVPIRKIPAQHHCGQCTQEYTNDYFRPQEVAGRPAIIVDTSTAMAKRGRPLVAKAPSPPPQKNPVGRPKKPVASKEHKNFIDERQQPGEVIDLTLSDEHARRSVLEDLRKNGAGGRTLEEILLQKKTDPQKKKPTFMIKDLISKGRPKERSPPRFAPMVISPINSIDRRQSVDTLSSSSSTTSSNAEAINGHFLDSQATLIPRGKLRYDKASHSLCRYFEEDQKRLFLKATVNTAGAGHEPKGQNSEHIIPLPRHILFNANENLTVEEYVREMTMVESLDKIPDFYQFYKFVTGYQICNNKTPVSFLTFLSIYNTDGLKKLLDRYVNSAMRRSV